MRELALFTAKEHVNTLAPAVDGKLWAMLHNLGSSALVQVRTTRLQLQLFLRRQHMSSSANPVLLSSCMPIVPCCPH